MPCWRGRSVRIQSRIDDAKGFFVYGIVVAMFSSSGGFGCRSAAEELDGDGGELVVELEDAAVAGVGVDDQFGARDAAVQVVGEHRRHHAVVVAVGDQGGLGELRQVGG